MPKVVGAKLAAARDQLASHAALAQRRLQARRAGAAGRRRRPDQTPKAGARVSAGERVNLVLVRAEHGVIPKLVGLPVDSATEKLESLKLEPEVHGDGQDRGPAAQVGHRPVPGA